MNDTDNSELHIEIRRGEYTTVIDVASSNLPRLDSATFDQAIEYLVEVADSEDGMWTRPNDNKLIVGPKSPIGRWPRTAVDHIELKGETGGAAFVPKYFRVKEQWLKLNKPVGEPITSNIALPSKSAFIQFPDAKNGAIFPANGVTSRTLEFWWLTANVMLSIANENVDVVGAHFIVQTPDWSGHFWGPRKKGSVIFGQIPGWPYGAVQIPLSLVTRTMTVTGMLNENNGMGAVEMAPHPTDQEKAPKLARDRAASATAELDKLRAHCEERSKQLAQHPITPDDVRNLEDVHELSIKNGLLTEVADCDEVSLPAADLRVGAVSTETTADWKVALNFREKILKLTQKLPELDKQDLERHIRELNLAIRFSTGADKTRSEEKLATLLKTGSRERELITRQRLGDECLTLFRTALMAGNANVYREAAEMRITHLRRLIELNPPWGVSQGTVMSLLYEFADGTAMLTGDQAAAANLFREAYQIEVAEARRTSPEAEQRVREKYAHNLPAWWPDDTPVEPITLTGSVGDHGDNDTEDVRKVKQRLHDLGFTFVGPISGEITEQTINAIKLFQAIINGSPPLEQDGRVDKGGKTHKWLEASNAPHWEKMPENGEGFINYGFQKPVSLKRHLYGTNWLADAIKAASRLYKFEYLSSHTASLVTLNDASLPEGGETSEHPGHEHDEGLSFDMRLPQIGNSGMAPGGRTYHSTDFDRDAARAFLIAFRKQPFADHDRIRFNDKDLAKEELCIRDRDNKTTHDNHIHVSVKAPVREP